jgi:hypothetical protein
MKRITGNLLTCILALWGVCGCILPGRISEDAVKLNKAVELAQNQTLLLNIVRASWQEPIYITAFERLRGNLNISAEPTLTVPFGGDATNLYTSATRIGVSSNPNYDVLVLDSEKFMRGIHQPISGEILATYMTNEWDSRLIFYLCVDSIQFTKDGADSPRAGLPGQAADTLQSFRAASERNTIASRNYEQFVAFVQTIVAAELVEVPTAEIALGKITETKQLSEYSELYGKGVRFRRDGETIKAYIPRRALLVTTQGSDGEERYVFTFMSDKSAQLPLPALPADLHTGSLTLRSPLQIIDYLGRGVRRIDEPAAAGSYNDVASAPVFMARPGRPGERALLSVAFRGVQYVIPDGGESGFSMASLSLLSRILALYKSREDFPAPTTVTVAGA